MANPAVSEAMRHLHPARLSYTMFSDNNPAMLWIAALAQQVREIRRPGPDDNPGRSAERQVSDANTRSLQDFGTTRDRTADKLFQAIYDLPAMQVLTGVARSAAPPRRHPGQPRNRRFVEQVIFDLGRRIAAGSEREAMVRAGLYVRVTQIPDERAPSLCPAGSVRNSGKSRWRSSKP